MNRLQTVHDMLVEIRAEHGELIKSGRPMPRKFQFGICTAFSRTATEAGFSGDALVNLEAKLSAQFLGWPEFSGNEKYPVPHPGWAGTGYASTAYQESLLADRWNPHHQYGAARLRLLDWLIEATKED